MSALALKVKMRDLKVLVIRSPDIGVIGVGEGSTAPLTTFLHGFLLADVKRLIAMAQPSWKLGIKFKWGPRPHFFYPFGPQLDFRPISLSRNIAFYCTGEMEDGTVDMAMMARDRIFPRGPDGRPQLHFNMAYHIENEKFVTYLEAFARHAGVEIIDDTIKQVQEGEAGVGGLVLESGRTETADLYIDCSGFRSLLVGQTLKEPFVSFKSSLFCERAVVGGWDRTTEPIHPYTTSEQMNSGWCWQIEHPTRINRGYVYCPDFISDDEAEREFRAQNPKIGPTRIVKFVSGRYERAWVKNVVAIGNSSGFVEPLEATALAVIAVRSQLLSEVMTECGRDVPQYQIDLYNRHHVRIWDSIRRFLALHYRFNLHPQTPFWKSCQNEADLAGAETFVEYYQRFGPSALWGPVLLDPVDPFGISGYLTVMVGQKAPFGPTFTPPPAEWEVWGKIRSNNTKVASAAMTIPEVLGALGSTEVQPPSLRTPVAV